MSSPKFTLRYPVMYYVSSIFAIFKSQFPSFKGIGGKYEIFHRDCFFHWQQMAVGHPMQTVQEPDRSGTFRIISSARISVTKACSNPVSHSSHKTGFFLFFLSVLLTGREKCVIINKQDNMLFKLITRKLFWKRSDATSVIWRKRPGFPPGQFPGFSTTGRER